MRQLDGTVEKRFSKAQMTYPIQVGCSLPSGLLSGQLSGGASGQQSAQHAWQVVPCQAAEHCPRLPGSLLPYALLKKSDCLPYADGSLYVQPKSMPSCEAAELQVVSVCCDCRPR